jgi:hypothetical protein
VVTKQIYYLLVKYRATASNDIGSKINLVRIISYLFQTLPCYSAVVRRLRKKGKNMNSSGGVGRESGAEKEREF